MSYELSTICILLHSVQPTTHLILIPHFTLLKHFLLKFLFFFFFNDTPTPEISPLSLHDALPICDFGPVTMPAASMQTSVIGSDRSQPVPSPAGMSVSGSATFTGLTVDLWDGQQWWAVANGSGTEIGRAHV